MVDKLALVIFFCCIFSNSLKAAVCTILDNQEKPDALMGIDVDEIFVTTNGAPSNSQDFRVTGISIDGILGIQAASCFKAVTPSSISFRCGVPTEIQPSLFLKGYSVFSSRTVWISYYPEGSWHDETVNWSIGYRNTAVEIDYNNPGNPSYINAAEEFWASYNCPM